MKKYIRITFDDWYREPVLYEIKVITEDYIKDKLGEDFRYIKRHFDNVDGAYYFTPAQSKRVFGINYGKLADTAIIDPDSDMNISFGRAQEVLSFFSKRYRNLLDSVNYKK
jgi:hypothetical protein